MFLLKKHNGNIFKSKKMEEKSVDTKIHPTRHQV